MDLVFDGTMDFSGGQDASTVPERVRENSVYAAVNCSMRNGVLNPRQGFTKLDLIFPEGGLRTSANTLKSYKDIFESGRFQMVAPYAVGVTDYLVVVISGVIFFINEDTLQMQVVPIDGGTFLNSSAFRLNWAAAGKFLVIFDYPAYPVIVESTNARRADPVKDEVPISVIGAFNENRLFIGNAGQEFTGGDPVGDTLTPDAPITFEEVLTPSSPYVAQVFSLPTQNNNDQITAMTFLPTSDISTGIGPFLIATHRGIWSFNTQNPRATWQQGGFGSNFVYEAGIAGPRALANVNSDLFFLSPDCQLRSASMARDEQHRWARVPISKEVQNWLKCWDPDLARFAAITYFNNKIIVTCNPYRVEAHDIDGSSLTDFVHGGFVVIELDNVSTLGQPQTPSWAGLWTGIRPMDILSDAERCFVIAKDHNTTNTIYELEKSIFVDTADGLERPVTTIVYTKSYDFKDPFQNKEVHSLDFDFSNIEGDFSVKTYFRPSHAYNFKFWREFKHNAPVKECLLPITCFNGFAPHGFRNITIGTPVDADYCDPVSELQYRSFRHLELKFIFKGDYWELSHFKIKAIVTPQIEQDNACIPSGEVKVCTDCNTDWQIEDFNTC